MIDLGRLPGGSFSEAWDIAENGWIVGIADVASGDRHAVLWTLEPSTILLFGLGSLVLRKRRIR